MRRVRAITALLAGAFALALAEIPTTKIPVIEIAPGVHMPMAGLGTWQYNDTVAGAAVAAYLSDEVGGTHIDTAYGYLNGVGIGKALAALKRDRSTYFITSKIPGGLNTSTANANFEDNLKQLQTSYVDLLLVHFPATWGGVGGKALRQEEWKAMEAFVKNGQAKAIGVSHYCQRHVEDILEINTVPIAVNQVQYHVGMGAPSTSSANATDGLDYMLKQKITYESFSPLCGPCGTAELINGSLVSNIGQKYGKTGAQVSLKWQVQQGIPVIPKTHRVDYMKQNIDLFDWELSDVDMAALNAATSPAVAGDGSGASATSGDCSVP
jgi:diketogulonate reductase-like aldo/keto reductase|eukprot:g3332.t1